MTPQHPPPPLSPFFLKAPVITIGRVVICFGSIKAFLILIILLVLPINTAKAFMPFFLFYQVERRLHGLIRSCLTSVVTSHDTVFSSGMIPVVFVLFSSKYSSSTTNYITTSTMIGNSIEGTVDDNENNKFTSGFHYSLDLFMLMTVCSVLFLFLIK